MHKKHILCIAALFFASLLQAQTLQEAKSLFKNGEFDKAKPAFERLVKRVPGNASYNYWYGACCYETGEKTKAEKYLKFGAKRKVQEAFRYLGQLYFDLYQYEESLDNYESYLEMLEKNKKPTQQIEKVIERVKLASRLLKGVEIVTVVDSFVVDKDKLLDAYETSPESGVLFTYNQFFETKELHPGMVYITEMGNKLFFSDNVNGNLDLFQKDRQLTDWSKSSRLSETINTDANENYPYVLSDGITLYYASDGEESIGGYDIFVTRYNTNTNNYLMPENVGMPFNSPANDYLFVLDEFNNLGWFASDRYQPEGKVCVYVFIPNASKETFNYENEDKEMIRSRAKIESIQDTWSDQNAVKSAIQRLTKARYDKPEKQVKHAFEFVIDDNTIYYDESHFHCAEAKKMFKEWQQKQVDLQKLQNDLDVLRLKYSKSKASDKKALTPGILDLEQRTEQLEFEVEQMPANIRNTELKYLSK